VLYIVEIARKRAFKWAQKRKKRLETVYQKSEIPENFYMTY
jgi:hypothetical protein